MIVCDTGPLVSALNQGEGRRHRFAAELLARSGRDVVVPWPVLVEVDLLLRSRGYASAAVTFGRALLDGVHQLHAPSDAELELALDLAGRYADTGVDLPDLSVIATAATRNAWVLTWDYRHFRPVVLRRGHHWGLLVEEAELPQEPHRSAQKDTEHPPAPGNRQHGLFEREVCDFSDTWWSCRPPTQLLSFHSFTRVYISYTPWYTDVMSVPVTARLDESVVEALDRAVDAGLAPNRGAVVARAVAEWLDRHGEEAIVESYRRRYAAPDAAHDQLIEKVAAFSLAACLADSER